MRRYPHILMAAGVAGALAVGLTAASAATAPGVAVASATQYTISQVWGPYDGQAKVGQVGSPDPDFTPTVRCHPHDSLLGGTAVINLKTSHGTAKAATVDLDRLGAYYDPTNYVPMGWGTNVHTNGRPGWSSVTTAITCLVRK